MVGGRRDQARLHVHRLRHQKGLAHATPGSQPFEQPVVEDALVGCVLIDKDQSLRPFRDQVTRSHLADRAQNVLRGMLGDPVRGGQGRHRLVQGQLGRRLTWGGAGAL